MGCLCLIMEVGYWICSVFDNRSGLFVFDNGSGLVDLLCLIIGVGCVCLIMEVGWWICAMFDNEK